MNPKISTKFNYEFVKNKLEELKKEQTESEEQENQKEEENKQEEQSEWDEQKDENEEDNNSDLEWKTEDNITEDSETEKIPTASSEFKKIQDYIDKLKAEEKYNREFYNNIQEKSSNSLFDNFFDRGSEKDW